MDDNQFVIEIMDLYWINADKDNTEELCLHGDVYVKIGEEVVADKYSCTVSSTGLYLLKSLEEDHIPEQSANQMLPCCGFFIIPNDNNDTVEISGCSNGIDWTIIHTSKFVKLITEKGTEVNIKRDIYRETVFCFVDSIKEYYIQCKEKILPKDDFENNGYIKFWKEWNDRRYKIYFT